MARGKPEGLSNNLGRPQLVLWRSRVNQVRLNDEVMIDLPNFDVIWDQPPIDGFSSVCHKYPPFKWRLGKEPR